jgi:hypothetical protein
VRPFGLRARNSGVRLSPVKMSTGTIASGTPSCVATSRTLYEFPEIAES